jgi:predicted MFS family arabinose efflux permease
MAEPMLEAAPGRSPRELRRVLLLLTIASPAFAMSMNISSANLGIALGALLGALVVDRVGVKAIG